MKRKTKRNNTDYTQSLESFQCVICAGLGYNIRMIEELTELTSGQQTNILKRYGIKRSNYRDGKSKTAKLIHRMAGKKLQAIILSEVKQLKD
jgi:hypothetical protein